MRAATSTSSLVGRCVRFALAGGAVAILYLAVTTALHEIVGIRFQIALIVGFVTAIGAHFTLQRRFVWTHSGDFALPMHQQAGRYVVVAGAQYGLTAASTALLPDVFDVRVTYVYLATTAVLTTANFVVFRTGVFHAKP